MKSCKFKTSKISRLSRENGTKSPGIRDGNFPKKSREIPSGNPGRETLVTLATGKIIQSALKICLTLEVLRVSLPERCAKREWGGSDIDKEGESA